VTLEGTRRIDTGLVLASVGASLIALLVATATLLPGVAFWDTGELQTVGPLLGTAHPTGFPTWVILGWVGSCSSRSASRPSG